MLLRFQRLRTVSFEAGANLDAETKDGYTPACVAAETGKAESLEALAEARASL